MMSYIYSWLGGQPQRITNILSELDHLKKKNLWHELSQKLLELVQFPEFSGKEIANTVHQNYIKDMETKMNPLKLLEILYYLGKHFEPAQFLEILRAIEQKVQGCDDALVFCKTLQGTILFDKMNDMIETKKLISEIEKLLDTSNQAVRNQIQGRFYKFVAKWSLRHSDFRNYYSATMRYLGSIEVNTLTTEEQVKTGRLLLISALVTSDFLDLRQLESHPIMNALRLNTPWFLELLRAVNTGDIQAVCDLAEMIKTVPEFVDNEKLIKDKTRLACVVKMAGSNRIIKLEEISKKTYIPLKDVEALLMKAMALDLIHGKIDQVDEEIHIDWSRPHVLNKEEMTHMIARIDGLIGNVEDAQKLLTQHGADLIYH